MSSIELFQSAKIRSVWNEEEQQWYFSVVDVVGALSSASAKGILRIIQSIPSPKAEPFKQWLVQVN